MFHPQFLDLLSLPFIFFNKSSLVKILVKFGLMPSFIDCISFAHFMVTLKLGMKLGLQG